MKTIFWNFNFFIHQVKSLFNIKDNEEMQSNKVSPYRTPGTIGNDKEEDIFRSQRKEHILCVLGGMSIIASLFAFMSFMSDKREKDDQKEKQQIEENNNFCAKFKSNNGQECPQRCKGVFESGKETEDCSCFKDSLVDKIPGRCLSDKISGSYK